MVKLPSIELPTNRSVTPRTPDMITPEMATRGIKAGREMLDDATKLVEDVHEANVKAEVVRRDNELKNRLFELGEETKDLTDPDAIEKIYDQRTAELKKQYLAGIPSRDAALRLDERWNNTILSGRQDISRKTQKLRQDQKEANLGEAFSTAFKHIGNVNFPEDRIPGLIQEQVDGINRLEADGTYSAVEAQRARDKWINSAVKTWSERKALKDPGAHTAFLENYLKAKKSGALDAYSTKTSNLTNRIITGKAKRPAYGWAKTNKTWQGLGQYEKAAAMSLMEANGMNVKDAKNVLGAMINRAANEGDDLGAHVSAQIYQPTWEPTQEARLGRILRSKEYKELVGWAKKRAAGEVPDPVQGATHFLAPESAMLNLEARDPRKYRSWRKWTGFDSESGSYSGVITRDKSHAFLAPEGKFEGAVGKIGPGGPEDQQNLVPLPPSMVIGHQLLENLSDVEVQDLLDKTKAQLQKNRTTEYYNQKAAAEGFVGRIKDGLEISPDMEAKFDENISYLKSIGRGYEANRIELELREAKFYRSAKSGKETINKEVTLSEMSPTELAAHEQGLAKLRRKADAIDSGLRENVNKEIETEIKRIKKLRNEDPAKSVENNTAVRAITEQVKEAEAVVNEAAEGPANEAEVARLQFLRKQELEARLAEQERIDIANPRLVTEEQARELLPISTTSDDRTAIKKAVEEAFQRKLEELGDAKLASKVVQDAYELIITKDERRTAYRSSLSAALRGEDERMVNRQAAIDAQANRLFGAPPETGRPKQLPRPTKADRDLLRQNANNPAYVSNWAIKFEPDAVTKVFNGWYDEVDQEMEDKAKRQAKAGEKAERTWSEYLFGE